MDVCYSDFLRSIGRTSLKAASKDTPDIWLEMPDIRNTSNKPLGFSIKSYLSQHLPTIFNASGASNIIYEITGDVTDEKISKLRREVKGQNLRPDGSYESEYPDYSRRIDVFKGEGLGLKYRSAETLRKGDDGNARFISEADGEDAFRNRNVFERNLRMIDCCMPQILADMTADAYLNGVMNISDLVENLENKDRFKVDSSGDYPFYKKKAQDMLVAMTTSMTAGNLWDGTEGTNGGMIFVTENGDVVCYHIFDRNDFRDFLFKNMKFDYPSNSRYASMSIIEGDDGKYYTNLNVQIRMGQKKKKSSSKQKGGYYDYEERKFQETHTPNTSVWDPMHTPRNLESWDSRRRSSPG